MAPAAWTGLFAAIYLAVLPMADTIALRNLALACLLVCLAWQFRPLRDGLRFGWPILLWAAYLLLFPLMADDHQTAWKSLGGQWGRGLLAMVAGGGAAVILSRRLSVGNMLLLLGAVSAVPNLVHLVMFAWKAVEGGSLPWGYWGRETHHADLGYAAGHATILLMAAFIAGDKRIRWLAVLLTLAAVLSTLAANSRAGVAFAVFGAMLILLPSLFLGSLRDTRLVLRTIGLGAIGVVVVFVFAFNVDPRWQRLTSELQPGFLGQPVQIECEGVPAISDAVLSKYGSLDRAPWAIGGVVHGDGSRIMLLRAGIELAASHPWGSDGSRQAFQKLLRQVCPEPAIRMAHTHNGWIDTMLAIGWLGAALYLGVLLAYLKQGWVGLRSNGPVRSWGLVLVALSIFWMVRGGTDSVFRDHMLEMQGFMLAFAAISIRMVLSGDARPSDAPESAPQATPNSRR